MSIIMQKLVVIGQIVAEIWKLFDFAKWRPFAILDL